MEFVEFAFSKSMTGVPVNDHPLHDAIAFNKGERINRCVEYFTRLGEDQVMQEIIAVFCTEFPEINFDI